MLGSSLNSLLCPSQVSHLLAFPLLLHSHGARICSSREFLGSPSTMKSALAMTYSDSALTTHFLAIELSAAGGTYSNEVTFRSGRSRRLVAARNPPPPRRLHRAPASRPA